jgi:hypothetical protein
MEKAAAWFIVKSAKNEPRYEQMVPIDAGPQKNGNYGN